MKTKREKRMRALSKLRQEYEIARSVDPFSYRATMLATQIANLERKMMDSGK